MNFVFPSLKYLYLERVSKAIQNGNLLFSEVEFLTIFDSSCQKSFKEFTISSLCKNLRFVFCKSALITEKVCKYLLFKLSSTAFI